MGWLKKARSVVRAVDDATPIPGLGTALLGPIVGGTIQASGTQEGEDFLRDVPLIGKSLGLDSSADLSAQGQTQALEEAKQQQIQGYGTAQGLLSPYEQIGSSAMNTLVGRMSEGHYDPGQFSYSGQRPGAFNYQGTGQMGASGYAGGPVGAMNYAGGPVGAMNYQDGPVDAMNYQGSPVDAMNYQGGPVDRSISSYMEDDPGLAWQQEQLQKQIDRAGAAQGRWGGGATMRESMREQQGLLSQDYGNRFNRAAMERGADVGAEQQQYGRALTANEQARMQEQQQYGRSLTDFGIAREAEQDAYGRALTANEQARMQEQQQYGRSLTSNEFSRLAEQDAYGRAQTQLDRSNLAEQSAYDRQRSLYDQSLSSEQDQYQRALGAYGMEDQRLQNQLAQQAAIANLGPQMSQAMANAAIGQGSALSNLSIQQGNVNAAATMANANQLGQLLQLAGQVAPLAAGI